MKREYKAKGSITVFLTLILLIILSLVMTTIESLRAFNMGLYAERALYTAMDSVLAEYYYPLFKEYHVFGLDGGYGTSQILEDEIENKISEYMQYTFNPADNIGFGNFKPGIKNFDLYGINTKGVDIKAVKTLMDYKGELFTNQAVEYSKLRLASDGVEALLDKAGLLNDTGIKEMTRTQDLLVDKMAVEESVSDMFSEINKLSEYIDGITINSKGPKANKNGDLQLKAYYVKKICNSRAKINNPYPANDWVSSSLKGDYINPGDLMDEGIEYLDLLFINHEDRRKAEESLSELLANQSSIRNDSELRVHMYKIQETRKDIDRYNEEEINLMAKLNRHMNKTHEIVEKTIEVVDKAIKIVNKIIKKQEELEKQIDNYKDVLKASKASIKEDLYSSLWEDYLELEKVKSNSLKGENEYNFQRMLASLEKNKVLLGKVKEEISFKKTANKELWLEGKEKLKSGKTMFLAYSHRDLQLDYKNLRKKEEDIELFNGANSLIGDGIMSLVAPDKDKISKKKLDTTKKTSLPSYLYKNKDYSYRDISSDFKELDSTNSFGKFSGILEGLSAEFDSEGFALSKADDLARALLYQKYFFDHFARFGSKSKVEMPTSLDYEIEYILQGKDSDYDNLKLLVSKLFALRMLGNTISVMTNSKSKNQARILATTLVGFMGIPVLITITKTIILFIWGFAESLVDVTCLLKDKAVALYKKFDDFSIDIKDLPFINRKTIQEKANKVKSKKSLLNLDYTDYLYILLILSNKEVKTYRALDLIQDNLQENYEDSFLISNCIYGFQVKSDFSMKRKFISLPFVQKLVGGSNQEYIYKTVLEHSY